MLKNIILESLHKVEKQKTPFSESVNISKCALSLEMNHLDSYVLSFGAAQKRHFSLKKLLKYNFSYL